jgi:hypothetical protein
MHVGEPDSAITGTFTSANLFERARTAVAKAFSMPSFAPVVA